MAKDVKVVLPKDMCVGKIEIVRCGDATEATVTVTDACCKPADPPAAECTEKKEGACAEAKPAEGECAEKATTT